MPDIEWIPDPETGKPYWAGRGFFGAAKGESNTYLVYIGDPHPHYPEHNYCSCLGAKGGKVNCKHIRDLARRVGMEI